MERFTSNTTDDTGKLPADTFVSRRITPPWTISAMSVPHCKTAGGAVEVVDELVEVEVEVDDVVDVNVEVVVGDPVTLY